MKQKIAGVLTASSIAILSAAALAASVTILAPTSALADSGNRGGQGGGNSGGHGGGNGGGNGVGNGGGHSSSGASSHSAFGNSATSHTSNSAHGNNSAKGSIHSELKGLNAAHASATAMANASPNSQVGRIATYRNAALATAAQADTLAASEDAYNDYLGTYTGPSAAELQTEIDTANTANAALQSQIDALEPNSPTYDEDRANLEAQMTDTTALMDQQQEAQTYETNLATLQDQVTTDQTTYNADLTTEQDTLNTATGGRTLSDAALAELRRELGL